MRKNAFVIYKIKNLAENRENASIKFFKKKYRV